MTRFSGSTLQYHPRRTRCSLYTTNSKGTGFVVAADLSSKTGIVNGQDAGALIATGQYIVVKLDDAEINAIPDAH